MIDEEENRIATLLARICDSTEEMDKVFNQIHIPVGYDIFCFDKILQAEQQRVDEEAAKKAELRKRLATRPSENGV